MFEPVVVIIGRAMNEQHILRIANTVRTRHGSWFNVEAIVIVRREQ